jgi:hypothetical protein
MLASGYFNFLLGTGLMFLALGLIVRILFSARQKFFALALVLLVLYFSHVIAFIVFCVCSSILFVWRLIMLRQNTRETTRVICKLSAVVALPLLLFVYYLIHDEDAVTYTYQNRSILWRNFYHLQPLVWPEIKNDHPEYFLSGAFITGIAVVLYQRLRKIRSNTSIASGQFILFFILAAICFLMALMLPDGSPQGGGNLSVRFLFYAIIFCVISLLVALRNRTASTVVIAVLLVYQALHIPKIIAQTGSYVALYEDISRASQKLENPRVICVLGHSLSYRTSHAQDLIATDQPALMLDTWMHKSFNNIQWSDTLKYHPGLLCWLDNPWACRPESMDTTFHPSSLHYLVFNNETSNAQDTNVVWWNSYFRTACDSVYSGESGLVLYRRR